MSYRFITGLGYGTFGPDELDYYGSPSGTIATLNFAPGETTKTLQFSTPHDNTDEVDENFTFEVFDPVNAELPGGAKALRTMGVVLDDDGTATNLAVLVSSPIVAEGDNGTTNARFEIRLSQPFTSSLTLSYTTIDGSAQAGSDYVAKSGTVTFTAGQTSAFVDVAVNGDTLREDLETFFLKVTPPAAAPAGSVGTATILNDDTAADVPSITIEPATITEYGVAGFIVRLDSPSVATVKLSYRFVTGPGYGTFGADELDYYETPSGTIATLTFAPGETSKTILFSTPHDNLDEVDESFTLEVFDPVNAELAGGAPVLRAMGVVLDDDGVATNMAVLVGSPLVLEGDSGTTTARFEIRLSQPHASSLTLNYTTIDGSAQAGSDYVARSGTITFAAGQTSAFVDVAVNGDTLREGLETFFLKVTPPAAAPDTAGSVGTATILNDDTVLDVPSVSIEGTTITEYGNSGFIVRLDSPSVATVKLSYRFVTGPGYVTFSAEELDYYGPVSGTVLTLTFAPGETTKTIAFATPHDNLDEVDENFTLEVFDPVNAELAGGAPVLRAMGVVLDDDGAGTNLAVLVGSPLVLEGDSGPTAARFEIRLSQPYTSSLTLNYTTLDGSAQAGSDYIARAGTITFAAGQTSAFVDVAVNGDTLREGLETFFLKVTPPTAASSVNGVIGAATILNDDTALDVPSVTIEPTTLNEYGVSGFIVRLDSPSLTTVTASYRFFTGNGFGTLSDSELAYYGATAGKVFTLTFAPGETSKIISFSSPSDNVDEIDESFTLELFSVTNAEIAGGVSALRASGIVFDDDGVGDNLAIVGRGSVVREQQQNQGRVEFEVRLSQPVTHQVKVNYSTGDGSAVAGADYVSANGVLTFEPGETVKYVYVTVLSDQIAEGAETLFLNLTPGTVGLGPNALTVVASIEDELGNTIGTPGDDILTGTSRDDQFSGYAGNDVIRGYAGNDQIDGGIGVDTAVFGGNRSAYTIAQTAIGVFTVNGPDGSDTLRNVEYARFDDQTLRLLPGSGTAVNFSASPSTYMTAIRDFDGNDLGAAGSWQRIGAADVNGDGDIDQIFVNQANGRFAEVATASDGLVYFNDYGWAGETRVVGIYVDPLVQSGQVQAGGPNDSQRRFQNDLTIGNIARVLGAGDYDRNGLQEVYFALTDKTAYLHAYMHADGNIQYANYQSQQQVIDYLTSNGFSASTYSGWFA